MIGYTLADGALPRRWALPITQGGMAAAMLVLLVPVPGPAPAGSRWRSTCWGALLGILLISQFWTLANVVYDPRQAKRLFGFIGGGACSAASPGRR